MAESAAPLPRYAGEPQPMTWECAPRMGPKTQRVYETIRSWIESGGYGPGDKLPSERTLSAELEIGRTALRQVLGPPAGAGPFGERAVHQGVRT